MHRRRSIPTPAPRTLSPGRVETGKKLITPQQDKDHNDVCVSGEKVRRTKWGGGEVVGFPREPVELVGSQRGVGEDKAWNGSRA